MNSWKDKFPKDLQEKIAEVDEMISGRLNEITEQELYNQQRVLELYRKHRVAEEDRELTGLFVWKNRSSTCCIMSLKIVKSRVTAK